MTIRFEANPPKILPDVNTEESIKKFVSRIKIISKKCDAIHLTENVLGHQGVSPITISEIIIKEIAWASADFHARFSAIWRHYQYFVYNADFPDPFKVSSAWHVIAPLNLQRSYILLIKRLITYWI